MSRYDLDENNSHQKDGLKSSGSNLASNSNSNSDSYSNTKSKNSDNINIQDIDIIIVGRDDLEYYFY